VVCVVHCHPVDTAFSEVVLESAMRGLEGRAEVQLFRLYANEEPTPADLAGSDQLVLVYPTWWGGMPGRILDWFQCAFAPWIDGGGALNESPLRSVSRLTAVTTHGASKFVNRLQGEPGKHLLQRTAIGLCAADVEFEWISLYGSDKSDDRIRQEFLKKVTSSMSKVEPPT
jgi:NAD(P)H dehydrogenase (quinone)